jgi:hypothetical protein
MSWGGLEDCAREVEPDRDRRFPEAGRLGTISKRQPCMPDVERHDSSAASTSAAEAALRREDEGAIRRRRRRHVLELAVAEEVLDVDAALQRLHHPGVAAKRVLRLLAGSRAGCDRRDRGRSAVLARHDRGSGRCGSKATARPARIGRVMGWSSSVETRRGVRLRRAPRCERPGAPSARSANARCQPAKVARREGRHGDAQRSARTTRKRAAPASRSDPRTDMRAEARRSVSRVSSMQARMRTSRRSRSLSSARGTRRRSAGPPPRPRA